MPRDAAVGDRGNSREHGDPKQANGRKARAVLDRPTTQGWKTSDEDEIALRRWRGTSEITSVEPLEGEHPLFGAFRVQSGSGGFYEVEIRSLDRLVNSCGCIDHRVNGLGTCKHIEGVLAVLLRRRGFRALAEQGNLRIEVFLDRRGSAAPAVMIPATSSRENEAARRWLAPFLSPDGTLSSPDKVQALFSAWHVAPAAIRRQVRLSRHFAPWLDRARHA
ncbi:MAG: hypothetical protein IT537_18680, partial [Hyphomicrobiales bacterium]|nr:hypothetical protein [Hyphomicrobiales bacterium]